MSNRTAYNELQAQIRRDSTKMLQHFKELYPERFSELQLQARTELQPKCHSKESPPRNVHNRRLTVGEIITQFRAGRKDYFIHTVDHHNGNHLYFHTLSDPSQALETLTAKHSQFTERRETITNIEVCTCPLCS